MRKADKATPMLLGRVGLHNVARSHSHTAGKRTISCVGLVARGAETLLLSFALPAPVPIDEVPFVCRSDHCRPHPENVQVIAMHFFGLVRPQLTISC